MQGSREPSEKAVQSTIAWKNNARPQHGGLLSVHPSRRRRKQKKKAKKKKKKKWEFGFDGDVVGKNAEVFGYSRKS